MLLKKTSVKGPTFKKKPNANLAKPVYAYSNSRRIANVPKCYYGIDEKFDGTDADNFEQKLNLFKKRCAQNNIE